MLFTIYRARRLLIPLQTLCWDCLQAGVADLGDVDTDAA